ncbi:hypothetical protein T265_05705 [Opisthorchis viverrini]|uniref:Uncharacterized protein n=1 Tax=Opisthorchis viverrini TaxID=6198 RepID=A0A075AEX8_OPIVI|nr:hypothetical protein T265_05705 [Opisthorchis viverrini]KER27169.1 hypothetical protein T265_05705 [Opisthorchis viverrini]
MIGYKSSKTGNITNERFSWVPNECALLISCNLVSIHYKDKCIAIPRISWRLKHEAAWCSTFICLETVQTRDSAGFLVSLSENQMSLQMSYAVVERNTLSCKQIWFCERLTWNTPGSLVCDVQVEHKVDGNSETAPN